MTISANDARRVLAEGELLFSNQEIHAALDELAQQITARLQDHDPIILCVMNGALIPAGNLLTRLKFPLRVDFVHATRYGNQTQGGELDWRVKPVCSLAQRTVLVIDDILDQGITLAKLLEFCQAEGAAETYSCVLVDKQCERKSAVKADFVGLTIPDRYVFGFGMDYKGYLRNVDGIYAVKGL